MRFKEEIMTNALKQFQRELSRTNIIPCVIFVDLDLQKGKTAEVIEQSLKHEFHVAQRELYEVIRDKLGLQGEAEG